MLSQADKELFAPLREELYHALLSAWCYNKKISSLGKRLRTETREFLLEELTCLRLISNDIVLRICNLDEDRSKFSLHALRKYCSQKHLLGQADEARMKSQLKTFRADINVLKTKHRNAYIAHLTEQSYPDPFDLPDLTMDFVVPLRTALRICEEMWGALLSFGFHLGSRDRTIDFREELGL